jgi:PAT family beta-lactamase induction signal transducer AmpG
MFNKVKIFFRGLIGLYSDPKMMLIALLGYSKGIPFTLIFGTYTYKLAEDGVDFSEIGNFGLAGLPFAIKFFWAPLADGYKIPVLYKLGQRKSWLIFSSMILSAAIALFGLMDASSDIQTIFYFAIVISFVSATYDISYDAFRISILNDEEQAAGVGASIVGYRIGVLTAGGLSLILADIFSWSISFIVIALSLIVAVIPLLFFKDGKKDIVKSNDYLQWLNQYIKKPFIDFIVKHKNWLLILSFIFLYKIGDALLGKMINPFYNEVGFTKTEIAEVTKFFGFAMTIIGGLLGGWSVYKLGIYKSLFLFGLVQALSNLSFLLITDLGHNLNALIFVIAFENISGALGTSAFVAYMSILCGRDNTATQFALFTSVESLGRWATNSPSGYLVDAKNGLGMSWEGYFIVTFLISIPALLLIQKIKINNS